jgi:hypothetical protein
MDEEKARSGVCGAVLSLAGCGTVEARMPDTLRWARLGAAALDDMVLLRGQRETLRRADLERAHYMVEAHLPAELHAADAVARCAARALGEFERNDVDCRVSELIPGRPQDLWDKSCHHAFSRSSGRGLQYHVHGNTNA